MNFTVAERVRRIGAHHPETLPPVEYARQIFWSTGADLPDDLEERMDNFTLEYLELPAGEKAVVSVTLPEGRLVIFDPVTHAAHFLDVKGEPTRERRSLSLVYNNVAAPTGMLELAPGPMRITFREPDHRPHASLDLGLRRRARWHPRPPSAVPHRQADPVQPDLPRSLPHRRPRHRPAPEDPVARLPVHRPQGLDRALRAGRRSRRLRPRPLPFPRAS